MIQDFKDEVLASEPRYRIKDNVGNVLNDNVAIEQIAELVQEGTPLNRATFGNIQGDIYTQDRYNTPTYSGNDMVLNLPLTSYEVGKIIKITAPVTLTNPTLNINNLGAKQINGTIQAGEKYNLVYNGESFDICVDYVTGTYTGEAGNTVTTKKSIELGFKPKAVIITKYDGKGVFFDATLDSNGCYGGIAIEGYTTGGIEITESGFNVWNSNNQKTLTNMTKNYMYIAFK